MSPMRVLAVLGIQMKDQLQTCAHQAVTNEVDTDIAIDEFDVVEEAVTIGGKNPFVPLHDSAELTLYDSYLLAFQFSLKHSLTKVAFMELLQLISVHPPKTASYPTSVHSIKCFFLECFPHANPEVHHYVYCTYCLTVLPSDDMCMHTSQLSWR